MTVNRRGLVEAKKQVKIKASLHRRLKALSFTYEIPLEQILNTLLYDALKDEDQVRQLIQQLANNLKN